MEQQQLAQLRLPVAERLAINACAELAASRVLCCSVGRGQCAATIAERLPASSVGCHFLDLYPAQETRDLTTHLPNLAVVCSADLPQQTYDLFVLPTTRGGEAMLTRDWLQQGYDRLVEGGLLIATVDQPEDTWLHHEIEKLGKNLDRTPKRQGVVYRLRRHKPLKRLRDFSNEFAFRDGEQLIRVYSRPGVFSHRQLDVGARALLEVVQINPGERLLDVGCGSGAVGLAAARRAEGVRVHAIDSNARAVQCTLKGAELNGITTMTAALTADGELALEVETGVAGCGAAPVAKPRCVSAEVSSQCSPSHPDHADLTGSFDVAVGNPPYYSHFQIAEIFLQTARRALRSGGRSYMVTKHPEWMVARMQQLFNDVTRQDVRGYTVVSGIAR